MSGNKDKISELCRWVEKAEHDLITAKATIKLAKNCPYDMVCFHAQQCVEKYIKSLLFWLNIDFPKTHDLRILAQKLPRHIFESLDVDAVLALNRYAIEARYPDDWEPFSRLEAKRAIATSMLIRKLAHGHLPKTCWYKKKT
jgi:HEPN domain-containing protein